MWKLVETDATQWDAWLASTRDASLHQSFGWGEWKRAHGWTPERWIAHENGRAIGLAQVLWKRFPFGEVGWTPGGPCVRFPDTRARLLPTLLQSLGEKIGESRGRFVWRCDLNADAEPELNYWCHTVWQRPIVRINSGFTTAWDLKHDEAQILAQMEGNHRRAARRALELPLEWRSGTDEKIIADLCALYEAMRQSKSAALPPVSREEIARQCAHLSGAQVLAAYENEVPILACLAATFPAGGGPRAIQLMSATSPRARENGAAYALFVRLSADLRARGVTQFDFGGLAPQAQSARGVDHFKRGFGGRMVQRCGEWEFSTPPALRRALNLALRFKSLG